MVGEDGPALAQPREEQLAAAAKAGEVVVRDGAHGEHESGLDQLAPHPRRRAPAGAAQLDKGPLIVAVVVDKRVLPVHLPVGGKRFLLALPAVHPVGDEKDHPLRPGAALGKQFDQPGEHGRVAAQPGLVRHHDGDPSGGQGIGQLCGEPGAEVVAVERQGRFARFEPFGRGRHGQFDRGPAVAQA